MRRRAIREDAPPIPPLPPALFPLSRLRWPAGCARQPLGAAAASLTNRQRGLSPPLFLQPVTAADLKPPFPANKTALNAWAANLPSAKNVSSLRLGAAKAAAVYDGVALAENV